MLPPPEDFPYHGGVMKGSQIMMNNESSYEVVVDARPYGPPLTSSEHAIQVGLALAFFAILAMEAWLLWNAWTIWA